MSLFGRKKIEKEFDEIDEIRNSSQMQPNRFPPNRFPPSQLPQMRHLEKMRLEEQSRFGRTQAPLRAPMPEKSPVPEPKEKDKEPAPVFAPVFVKLSRYKQILSDLNYLKMGINLIRNQIAILSELERLQAENMKVLHSTIEKMSNALVKLDSEFMTPSGFMEDVPEMEMNEVESLENTITDLRAQIEGLKGEVESM